MFYDGYHYTTCGVGMYFVNGACSETEDGNSPTDNSSSNSMSA